MRQVRPGNALPGARDDRGETLRRLVVLLARQAAAEHVGAVLHRHDDGGYPCPRSGGER